jgi:Recombination endonuclease VII
MDDIIPQKRCSRCGQVYSSTTEYFHINSQNADNLHSHCKKCRVVKKENPQKGGRPRKIREDVKRNHVGRPRIEVCTRCGEADLTKFYCIRGRRKAICKKCDIADKSRQQKANPEAYHARMKKWRETNKDYQRKWTYGLSQEDYDAMIASQNGVCRICGHIPDEGKAFHVDHCHATGKVRGLLCSRCNTGLGMFRDDPDALRKAADYLEQ